MSCSPLSSGGRGRPFHRGRTRSRGPFEEGGPGWLGHCSLLSREALAIPLAMAGVKGEKPSKRAGWMGVSTNSDDPHICLQTAKRAPVTARMPARSAEKAVSESNFQEDHLPRLHEISCRESVRIKRHSGALRHQIPLRMPPELSFHSLAPRLASLPTGLRWEVTYK